MNNDFVSKLKRLSEFHRENCMPYRRLCEGLSEEMPFVPVSVFKELDLKSVSDEQIVACLTSSGTTGQKPSKIYLDEETSRAQQMALVGITESYLKTGQVVGDEKITRMPMLIIDTPEVLKKRNQYSARAAAIMGFSVLSTRRYYALDENYQINEEEIQRFLEKTAGKPFFVFGFTWLIWEYFCEPLKAEGKQIDLSGGSMIHGGGWKKLADRAVSRQTFHEEIESVCGIRSVMDYYGMAEQTGSIFMECECGHLHVSKYSDIHFLNPISLAEDAAGVIAVDSLLPKSYPGHRLLTEDLGRCLGQDDCPCGRKGKYFEVLGRIPRSEIRGCSDTFESVQKAPVNSDIQVLAGEYPPRETSCQIFDETVMTFLDALSGAIRKLPDLAKYPDLAAFGFWCRRRHLIETGKSYQTGRNGVGMVFHVAPSNMPLLFAYSWAASLLAGNANIVRISQKASAQTEILCECITRLFEEPAFQKLAKNNAIIRFARNEEILKSLTNLSKACLVWGGDETVARVRALTSDDKEFLGFPDKYSIAVIRAGWASHCSDEDLRVSAIRFCQDTYASDQNACSSPHTVFWLKDGNTDTELKLARNRWWNAVLNETSRYPMDAFRISQKYGEICKLYMGRSGLKPLKRWGNALYTAEFATLPDDLTKWSVGFGCFFEYQIESLDELESLLTEKIQTVVCVGTDAAAIETTIRKIGCSGVDRVVSCGEALEFSLIWDRKDLIFKLSE